MSSTLTTGKLPVVFGHVISDPLDILGSVEINHETGEIKIQLAEGKRVFSQLLEQNMELMYLSFAIKAGNPSVIIKNKETK